MSVASIFFVDNNQELFDGFITELQLLGLKLTATRSIQRSSSVSVV
jgi:hypothetical protein